MPKEKEFGVTIVEPAITPEEAKAAIRKFGEMEKAMLDEDDFQEFESRGKKRRFPKKGAFRKLALAFNVSDEILEERFETKGENNQIGIWHFTVKAIAPNGRYSMGVGSFSSDEREVAHFEHDPRAMAHTRAKNRAISDLIAGGILSAEEVLGIPEYKQPPKYGKTAAGTKPKEEKLKHLRQSIAIEWNKTGKSEDERKAWQKDKYGVESMSELKEEQLTEMLVRVKDMQPTMADLGFSSQAEQGQMRKDLFKLLTEVGLDTDDKKKEYLSGKGVTKHTAKLTRDELESIIEEVQKDKETVAEAEEIPEDI